MGAARRVDHLLVGRFEGLCKPLVSNQQKKSTIAGGKLAPLPGVSVLQALVVGIVVEVKLNSNVRVGTSRGNI